MGGHPQRLHLRVTNPMLGAFFHHVLGDTTKAAGKGAAIVSVRRRASSRRASFVRARTRTCFDNVARRSCPCSTGAMSGTRPWRSRGPRRKLKRQSAVERERGLSHASEMAASSLAAASKQDVEAAQVSAVQLAIAAAVRQEAANDEKHTVAVAPEACRATLHAAIELCAKSRCEA